MLFEAIALCVAAVHDGDTLRTCDGAMARLVAASGPVEHEPGRLLRDPYLLRQLKAADPPPRQRHRPIRQRTDEHRKNKHTA